MRSCFLSEILALTASIKYIGGWALNPVRLRMIFGPLVIKPIQLPLLPRDSSARATLLVRRGIEGRTRTLRSASKDFRFYDSN